jgi:hypothetical protein
MKDFINDIELGKIELIKSTDDPKEVQRKEKEAEKRIRSIEKLQKE